MYDSKIYENYDEFLEADPSLAKKFFEEVGQGSWQEERIAVYASLEDFAKYEVSDGWYSESTRGLESANGAPVLLNFIDYEKLGEALADSWDESTSTLLDGKVIITA